jgi:FAD/FMN-containing dehydrogenase
MTAPHAGREIRPDDGFEHLVSHRPALVHRPDEPVVAQGEGHSTFAQAQSAGGVPADPRSPAGVLEGAEDPVAAEALVAADEKRYHRARSLGAVQYPVGSDPRRPADWTVHFGPAWPLLQSAKQHYDPDNVLGSGRGVFVRLEGK